MTFQSAKGFAKDLAKRNPKRFPKSQYAKWQTYQPISVWAWTTSLARNFLVHVRMYLVLNMYCLVSSITGTPLVKQTNILLYILLANAKFINVNTRIRNRFLLCLRMKPGNTWGICYVLEMGKLLKHLVCVLFIIFLFNLMLHFLFFVSVFCMSAISVPPGCCCIANCQ